MVETNDKNPYAPPMSQPGKVDDEDVDTALSAEDIRRLRSNSKTIHTLGFLWLCAAAGVIVANVLGLFGLSNTSIWHFVITMVVFLACMGAGVVMYVRPKHGHIWGIIACVFSMWAFPIGTLMGIFGIIALGSSQPLFGPNRLTHRELKKKHDQ